MWGGVFVDDEGDGMHTRFGPSPHSKASQVESSFYVERCFMGPAHQIRRSSTILVLDKVLDFG